MRFLWITNILILISNASWAQTSDCSKFLSEAEAALNKPIPDFKTAILKYNSARAGCGQSRHEEIDKKIIDTFNKIDLLRKQAEKNAEDAKLAQLETEKAKKEAERLKKLAITQADSARLERDRAQGALNNLEKALKEVVKSFLRDADKSILNLDYQSAWSFLRSAATAGVSTMQIAQAMLEPAFWHAEAGNFSESAIILDTVAQITGNQTIRKLLSQIPGQDSLKKQKLLISGIISLDDSLTFKKLMARYYPAMINVSGGSFIMGCDNNLEEECGVNDKTHPARVSDFAIAATETTVWQWAIFCNVTGKNIKDFFEGSLSDPGNNPIINVPWDLTLEYANWLNYKFQLQNPISSGNHYSIDIKANGYRLPTEAEWEYASRNGVKNSKFLYSGGDSLSVIAWYIETSGGRPRSVNTKFPNQLGIYGLSGNVSEWCWDLYTSYPLKEILDYTGPDTGIFRVIRGGNWSSSSKDCRVTKRLFKNPNDKKGLNTIGFRLARTL